MVISIIIPAYNEESRIGSTLRDIREFDELSPKYIKEVIVVDDGSKDGTFELVNQLQQNFKKLWSVRTPVNKGKWSAIHTGLSMASGDVIVLMDADNSVSIRHILSVPNGFRLPLLKYDVVERKQVYIANRFGKNSVVVGKSALRGLVSRVYRVYARMLFRYATGRCAPSDTQCPFKVFARKSVNLKELQVERFAGDIELFVVLAKRGSMFKNVDCHFEHVRGSKVSSDSVFSMLSDTWQVAKRARKERFMNNLVRKKRVVAQYRAGNAR